MRNQKYDETFGPNKTLRCVHCKKRLDIAEVCWCLNPNKKVQKLYAKKRGRRNEQD